MFSATAVSMSVAILALMATLALPSGTAELKPLPAMVGAQLTVAVDGGADYTSISEAVAAAQDGDTVLVAPGRYDEALIVDKDITLRGTGDRPRDVAIYVPEDAPAAAEAMPPLSILLHGPETPPYPAVGIQVLDSSATLANLNVMGLDDGIAMLVRGGAPALEAVVLSHRSYLGPSPDCAERGAQEQLAGGLFILDGADASITASEVWHTVRIDGDSSASIKDSLLQFPAVAVQGGSTIDLVGNSIWACENQALSVTDGSTATIRNNKFHSGGVDVRGTLGAVASATIEDNTFDAGHATSVYVNNDAQATIAGNRFYGNQNAVTISHADAVVRDNKFVSNANAINLMDSDSEVMGNTISDGEMGIATVSTGTPTIRDNSVDGVASRGIVIGGGRPIIEGNHVCGSEINLSIAPNAEPVLGENDICPDGAAMVG